MPMYGSVPLDASVRVVQRRLTEQLPDALPTADGAPLELSGSAADAPRCHAAALVEGHALRAHRLEVPPDVGIAAFLDGTQRSRTVAFVRGLPVVWGTVAAVVRERRNRRLTTWGKGPVVRHVLAAPLRHLDPREAGALVDLARDLGAVLRDTSADAGGAEVSRHPLALTERARGLVEYEREDVEQRLAERWCDVEHAVLVVDGGISGSERIAQSACTVGVVKSHRTLHVDDAALPTLCALPAAARTSVFRIAPARRTAVLSWYLRLRDPRGHDPFFGLVRVEVAEEDRFRTRPELVSQRADDVSRWILAEVAPLALPDARWDKMMYGIRDCEEFLRAVC